MKFVKIFVFLSLVFSLLFIIAIPEGYSQVEEAIEQLTGDNTKGYLQPFVNSFANNLNSGLYRTAHVSAVGLHFYVGLAGMVTMIPDDDKIFMGVPPQPFPSTPVETATVFGEEGAVVSGPGGLNYAFQDGVLNGNVVPFAVPQLEVGSFLGTMVKIRYFSGDLLGADSESLGSIKLIGYGLQHSISQYFLLFPIDVSAGFFYQKFDIGDYLSTKAVSFGLQASKSVPLLTVYGTLALETTKMDISYTYEGGDISEDILLELKSDNKFRFTAGLRLRLGLIILNGDYSLGNQNTASIGIGLGI